MREAPTVRGTLVQTNKTIVQGARGGLFYWREDPVTHKRTRVYLKKYQRAQCTSGVLAGAGDSCRGIVYDGPPPHVDTGRRAYGGYVREE